MLSVYQTLSLRYLRQRWTRALLIVASIALGVATLVATLSLNRTMDRAVRVNINPLAGGADLLVSQGNLPIDKALAAPLADTRGVRWVRPLLFANIKLPDLGGRTALLVGVDVQVLKAMSDNPWGIKADFWGSLGAVMAYGRGTWCVLGEELNKELDGTLPDRSTPLRVQAAGQKQAVRLTRIGTVTADGPAAALGGSILVTQIDTANEVLGRGKGLVSRLDVTLEPGYDPEQVRGRIQDRLARLDSKAEVRTPEEQTQSAQRPMAGMQAGFTLCGLGALVVGMFLVYNALSVSVTERRHEIGILRSLGATRTQVRGLFAGEALVLGLAGAVLGVPLGLGLAYLALEPMKGVIREVFRALEANRVEWGVGTVVIATGAGMVTAVLASLVPAFRASAEEPAVAVRRVPQNPTWALRVMQITGSAVLLAAGAGLIVARSQLPERAGSYGGLVVVLLGALLATPLLAAGAARLVQPAARRWLGIEGRLGADNLVRAPARTGLVIAALAAGVALVLQTAGITRSNRTSVHDWLERYVPADVIVSAGSLVSAAGDNPSLEEGLGAEIRRAGGGAIRAVLPVRFRHLPFRDSEVKLVALDARSFYETDRGSDREVPDLDLYRRLGDEPGAVLVSENFAALFGAEPGDMITLGGVPLRVLGKVVDYQWYRGTVLVDWADYRRRFRDRDSRVNQFDVYLNPGADAGAVETQINRRFGNDLTAATHAKSQQQAEDALERLYAVAYGQQVVVALVAALGVVTALLIAVLQRRRELGVLRAIGASQAQVVRSVLAEAALMGVIGTAIGLAVGVPLEWYTLRILILNESGYLFPVLIPWREAVGIAGAALLLATLAGLWPALNAVRQRIPEAIAHE